MKRPDHLTDAQYYTLRNLADGVQPKHVPPPTRRFLVRKGYVTAKRIANHRFELAITEAGSEALTRVPRLRPSIPKGLL